MEAPNGLGMAVLPVDVADVLDEPANPCGVDREMPGGRARRVCAVPGPRARSRTPRATAVVGAFLRMSVMSPHTRPCRGPRRPNHCHRLRPLEDRRKLWPTPRRFP